MQMLCNRGAYVDHLGWYTTAILSMYAMLSAGPALVQLLGEDAELHVAIDRNSTTASYYSCVLSLSHTMKTKHVLQIIKQ